MDAAERPGRRATTWSADLVAGIAMAGLLLPEGVAYSGIANMPPQAGVLGLFAGLLVYGLIGRSRFAIVSATSSSAAVMGATTLSIAGPDAALRVALASGLVFATGLSFVLASAARLGSICNFISKPVLRGFSFGLAVVIVVRQLPKMTGVHPQASALIEFCYQLLLSLPHWNWIGVAFGLCTLALLRAFATFRRAPGALLVIAAGIAMGRWLDIKSRGVDVVGPIHLSLAAPMIPDLSLIQWSAVGQVSLAMLLLLFAESYGAIRSMALKHGDEISPDRDLLAFGVANLMSGLFQGMPVGAGYSATSANESAGAQSRKAAWIAAATVLLVVATCLPLIELTPEPVLAAVVVHAVSHTLTLDAFRPYFQWQRDRIVVVAAALAVVLLGVLNGLLAGIAISLAMTLRGLSVPRISELGRLADGHDFLSSDSHPDVRRVAGLLVLRPEAPLFFANVERMLAEVRQRIQVGAPQGVVLSLEETPDLDGTSIEALVEFSQQQSRCGRTLVLARLKDPVLALLRTSLGGATQTLLEAGSVDDAVAALTRALAGEATVANASRGEN